MKIVLFIISLSIFPLDSSSASYDNQWQPIFQCVSQDDIQQIDSVVYEISSRGIFEKLVFTKDNILFTNDRRLQNHKDYIISNEDWVGLNKSISDVGIENIERFSPKTDKRKVDGAPYAKLVIYINTKLYKSKDFDHKSPPKELSSIMKIIYDLREQLTKE